LPEIYQAMLKNVSAIIFGLITGFVLIRLTEFINHSLFPPPTELFTDKEAIKAYVEQLPLGAKLLVIAGWAIGSFGGAYIATVVEKSKSPVFPLIVGGLFMIMGVLNMLTIPHPVWFWVLSLLAFIPMAYAGFLVALKSIQLQN
jgi:hypothetical protein